MVTKIKIRFLTCFNPVAEACVIVRGKGFTFYDIFFDSALSVWFHFSGTAWIDKWHYFDQGIYFPNNVCHGNRKKGIFQLPQQQLLREKRFMKNLNFIDLNYCWKNWVAWINARWDKKPQHQKCTFLQKGCKS